MEVPLVRILLAIIENIFLQATNQQPYSPPPESSQPSTPLASESGAKRRRRRRRRKQKILDGGEVVSIHKNGVKKSPFPILLLCGATQRRITGLYNDLSRIVCAKKYDIGKVSNILLYL
ncbi:hypothetical protein GUJ93_ZPchr0008g13784 [Zizania palustris]|uniref:Uncharacterized protein n=1 Tax=Zizania palustris TaxID=103762 RepID=A0A8J5VFE5_ZIZPA|nr:hypothetical protein GUJ93_ZPchr0008g13784 [Zizania palustris]